MTEKEIAALESIPVTEEQVAKFMAECDAGLHPVPSDLKRKMDESWLKLSDRLFGTDILTIAE